MCEAAEADRRDVALRSNPASYVASAEVQAPAPDHDSVAGPLWYPLAWLNALFNRVACLFILGILAFTLVGVFTRYVLRDPAVWTYPVSSYLLLWVIYLATASALQNGYHVRVTFLLYLFPPRICRYLEAAASFLTAVFVTVFLWQVVRLFSRSWAYGYHDTSYLHVPLYLAQLVMPSGLVLLLATAINQLVIRVKYIREAA